MAHNHWRGNLDRHRATDTLTLYRDNYQQSIIRIPTPECESQDHGPSINGQSTELVPQRSDLKSTSSGTPSLNVIRWFRI